MQHVMGLKQDKFGELVFWLFMLHLLSISPDNKACAVVTLLMILLVTEDLQ